MEPDGTTSQCPKYRPVSHAFSASRSDFSFRTLNPFSVTIRRPITYNRYPFGRWYLLMEWRQPGSKSPLQSFTILRSLTSIFLIFSVSIAWYVEAIFAVFTCSHLTILTPICSSKFNERMDVKIVRWEKVEVFKTRHNLTRLF
jgi:hypothetical protein